MSPYDVAPGPGLVDRFDFIAAAADAAAVARRGGAVWVAHDGRNAVANAKNRGLCCKLQMICRRFLVEVPATLQQGDSRSARLPVAESRLA